MTIRPCWVEIHTQTLEDNLRFLLTLAAPHVELLAVLKADAYGHSMALCGPAVGRAGARWLGVASVEEGVAARALCPEARILVFFGAFPGEGAATVRDGLTAVVWQPWQLDELETAAREAGMGAGSVPVHLEIDTGMSRQGVTPENLGQGGAGTLLRRFTPESPLRLEGVMTHLFAADEADGRVTEAQLGLMDEALGRVKAAGLDPEWLNVGASASRLALYGVIPQFDPVFELQEPASLVAARTQLHPVMEWKTRVAGVRSVVAGTVVGYNGTFVATEPMRLALVAAGYADGLDRRLGNRFSLLVRGARAPLVGRVSMDMAVVDVTEIAGVEPGDEVVILGTQGGESITASDHAETTGTIPWEVFTRIGARARRVAV